MANNERGSRKQQFATGYKCNKSASLQAEHMAEMSRRDYKALLAGKPQGQSSNHNGEQDGQAKSQGVSL